MTNKRVVFHEAAADEHLAALDWYIDRSEEAAFRFAVELELAVALISKAPQRWPVSIHGTHRLLLKRFPFVVVYREIASFVPVLAVAHTRSETVLLERAALGFPRTLDEVVPDRVSTRETLPDKSSSEERHGKNIVLQTRIDEFFRFE